MWGEPSEVSPSPIEISWFRPNLARQSLRRNGLLTYDPVTQNALLYSGGGRFYEYDVKQDTWSQLPVPSFAALLDRHLGHIAAVPIDTYGAIVLLMQSGQMLVYKHR
jgi:hypothetical protein